MEERLGLSFRQTKAPRLCQGVVSSVYILHRSPFAPALVCWISRSEFSERGTCFPHCSLRPFTDLKKTNFHSLWDLKDTFRELISSPNVLCTLFWSPFQAQLVPCSLALTDLWQTQLKLYSPSPGLISAGIPLCSHHSYKVRPSTRAHKHTHTHLSDNAVPYVAAIRTALFPTFTITAF